MAYNYDQKGVWRVQYKLASNDTKYDEVNRSTWIDAKIEEQLKYGDFTDALKIIDRIKNGIN